MYTWLPEFPAVSRLPEDILKLFGKSPLGIDFEWDQQGNPTILGLSDGITTVSVPWADGKPFLLRLLEEHPDTVLVGHNIIGADSFVLAEQGINVPVENMEDTIILHYLVNMNLCKTTKKDTDDEGERRGRGFMNLWTMSSIYTDLPFWKECREEPNEGPCRIHDPYGYNGTDALAPVLALPKLREQIHFRGLDHLYDMHKKLGVILGEMNRFGIYVDVPYISELRSEFEASKAAAAKSLSFNPESPKQIAAFFSDYGVHLADSREETIRDAVAKYENADIDEIAHAALLDLLDYKELGDGPDRWFLPVYTDTKGWLRGFLYPDGTLHPHLGPYTSSGRLMCAGPNLQNVPKRRLDRHICECGRRKEEHATLDHKFKGRNLGKLIRRAIIAPVDHYIVRADYSNAENRVFLVLAGYVPPDNDLHLWMVKNIGLTEQDEFSIRLGSARDASKSVSHASDYMEGLQLITEDQLHSRKIQTEIDHGARIVFPDWHFQRRIVTFTGINLARRAFGKASYENRHRALEIVERYMGDGRALGDWPAGSFPKIRDLQRRITDQIQDERVVHVPTGYTVISYGMAEDRIKQAAAIWGSNPVAHVSKQALIDIAEKRRAGRPMREVMQIHDEILTYVPSEVAPETAMPWLKASMEQEIDGIPGFRVPTDASYGPNWRDQTKDKK